MGAKTVVITGCTRGLGRAMVGEFLRAGWRVAGCGRDTEQLAALEREGVESGGVHFFGRCDVAREGDVAAFCAEVIGRFGAPQLVLNNAAIINGNAPLWRVDALEFSRVVDVNLKGVAALMRHFLPAMLHEKGGVIVNFSSGWGRSTSPEVAPYCATKWAVEGLSQAVAQETDGRVAIVALNPGIIDTDMLRSTFGEGAAHYPDARSWAKRAVPFLAGLGLKENGRSLNAP
jgi:NAD(P)-dependent dehydrogenase (short-subunit alcohol dehydrogenase family)